MLKHIDLLLQFSEWEQPSDGRLLSMTMYAAFGVSAGGHPRPFTHKPASAVSVGVGCGSIRLEKEGVQIKERMRLLTPTPRSFQNRRLLTPVGLEQVYQCLGLCLGSSAFVSWNVPMRQSGAAGAWQPASRLPLWRQGRARDSWKQLTMIISIFRCDD